MRWLAVAALLLVVSCSTPMVASRQAAPVAVDALAAIPGNSLTLDWTDTNSASASTAIERREGLTGVYASLATTPPGAITYADETTRPGVTYCYRALAFNASGQSDYSNEACNSTPLAYALTVSVSGQGSVSSSPVGITCPTICSAAFAGGIVITLTATPKNRGQKFLGWGGACFGANPVCPLTLSGPLAVSARFGGNGRG